MLNIQSTIHTAQHTMHSKQCTVHNAQYTMHNTQCTIHIYNSGKPPEAPGMPTDLLTNGFSVFGFLPFFPLILTPSCFLGFNLTGGLITGFLGGLGPKAPRPSKINFVTVSSKQFFEFLGRQVFPKPAPVTPRPAPGTHTASGNAQYTMHNTQCTIYNAQYTKHNTQNNNTQCTVYNAQ